MKIAVITDQDLREELMAQGMAEGSEPEWIDKPVQVPGASAYIDLLFTPDIERMNALRALQPALLIVNALTTTLDSLPEGTVRFNGWKTFLARTVVEASARMEESKILAGKIFARFGKTTEWVPDIIGFISPRIVSSIINEAYFALQEEVSSKNEIDTAMKLGTNYPYGPFEWGGLIGLNSVHTLLTRLAESDPRYEPASLLKKEAGPA